MIATIPEPVAKGAVMFNNIMKEKDMLQVLDLYFEAAA